jgi:Arc/MetJ-type ribon-helix-helix transcriptional regulator
MPSVLEAVAKEPAEAAERLVVYITRDQAQRLEELRQEANARGRRLSASAIVRAALDELLQDEEHV